MEPQRVPQGPDVECAGRVDVGANFNIASLDHCGLCLIEKLALEMVGCSSDALLEAGTSSQAVVPVAAPKKALVLPIKHGPAPLADWSTLQIEKVHDDDGRIATMTDERMYIVLGPRDEDERAKKVAQGSASHANATEGGASKRGVAQANVSNVPAGDGTKGVVIPVDDSIPLESMIMYDKDNLKMELGIMYPNMKDYRLVMRQYAINE